MKIAISHGAFLPVPPVLGGATVKIWHRLAALLAARGHEVIAYSRQWPGWPDHEMIDGVRHKRLPGHDHYSRLWQNLLLDLRWSLRVRRALAPDALVISHNVTLPFLLTALPRRHRAPVSVVLGRMPKGQCRLYRRVQRIYATSSAVATAAIADGGPRLAPLTRTLVNPIDWAAHQLQRPRAPRLRIGYAGRIHPEKGLRLLLEAAALLARQADLPNWEITLVGPADIPAGGAGPAFVEELRSRALALGVADRFSVLPPLWSASDLAAFYASCELFAYPSVAERGETFGVSPLEAMAAGAVPVVSALNCFSEFIRPAANGLVFDHRAPDAAEMLASTLATALREPDRRRLLSEAARADARAFDYSTLVDVLETDLIALHRESAIIAR